MTGNIAELVHMFLGGLRERSQYAVALQEVNQNNPTFLSFKKGELIVLIKDDELTVGRGWIKGKNERTSKTGAVPTDAILVLPTLTKPTNEFMTARCNLDFTHSCACLPILHTNVTSRLVPYP
ncbi:unconventional myosin-VIIb [Oncorhynchus mykiss]|uniref:unconventional myosin-VIIb n=1 Tax=Oncorhynchus mykiss TaxID=8022 RepID=UPI001877E5C2|nr:unconventional myosin-VIIb [Oncorhynchus mykiss]